MGAIVTVVIRVVSGFARAIPGEIYTAKGVLLPCVGLKDADVFLRGKESALQLDCYYCWSTRNLDV